MVRGKPDAWDPQICLAWGETFLAWIKSNVVEGTGTPESVWRVVFTPCVGVELTLLQGDERRDVEAGGHRVGFLPDWYWEEIQDIPGEHGSTGTKPEPSQPSAATTPSASALPTGWQI
jgi:RAT1-interacting protein